MKSKWSYPVPAAFLMFYALFYVSCSNPRYPDALSPEAALDHFELDPRFKIEIYAAEPYVQDPVDMIFDGLGNSYVIEMPDYPFKPEPGKGKGRIKMLSDTNGDGRVDKATVFADSITEATTILPWKGGLLVSAAPNILYLKDTNGDGRADSREVLFSGFYTGNMEAQITNLSFGIDNWIYANDYGQPGTVKSSNGPDTLAMAGWDFRFRLDRGKFEWETGRGQFGQALDDWGHRFFTQNTIHIQEAIIPARYIYRNPFLPTKGAVNISNHELEMYQKAATPYWRAERTRRRQKQYAEDKSGRVEYAEGHFTAASGGTFYGGDAFPKEFYGNIFTGDVSGQLVHRDVLEVKADSPAFVAKRAVGEEKREFLTSTDTWFRPVNFAVGPDGCLYVVDMYRQHIEHPTFIPEDLKADMDFMKGSDRGRIYRIVPKEGVPKAPLIQADAGSDYYVGLLSHPNRWWRLYAQRILLERQDKSVIPAVKKLFMENKDPRTRLHALYVLEGLNSLDAGLVGRAMQDVNPGVRENGAILSERYPENLPLLIKESADSSARVALQATLSLGQFPAGRIIPTLLRVVEAHNSDPWFRKAVLSSEAGSSREFLGALTAGGSFFAGATPGKLSFMEELSYVFGSRNREGDVVRLLGTVSATGLKDREEWQLACLKGLSKGLAKSKKKVKDDIVLKKAIEGLGASSTEKVKASVSDMGKLWNVDSAKKEQTNSK